MSATEEKTGDRSDSSEQQDQDSSRHQEGRADAENGKRREEEDNEQQETKAEEKKDDEKKDEKSSKPGMWKKLAGALPLIFGLGFCVAFFVWVCLQMAGQTVGGPPLLLGIFGGSLLGILAAGAGIGFSRLTSDD